MSCCRRFQREVGGLFRPLCWQVALLILLLPRVGWGLQGATTAGPGRGGQQVAGRVLDAQSGRPLARAEVDLEDDESNKLAAETISAQDGSFRLPAVPAGRYRLTGRAHGYLRGAYLQHGELSSAVVTGSGLATDDLVLRLTRSARVEGVVVDEVRDPVLHATVSLYRQSTNAETSAGTGRVARVRTAQTQDDGRFNFRNLPEGSYFVAATAMPWYAVHPPVSEAVTGTYRTAVDPALDVAYPPLFYPGVLRSDQAAPIALHAGEEFTADLQMVPVPAVTLTLDKLPGEGGNQRFPYVTRSIFGIEESVPMQGSFRNGVQEVSGLAPGEYLVQSFATGDRVASRAETVDLTGGSAAITFGADKDVATVSVQVGALPGVSLPSGLQLNLRDLARGRPIASAKLDAKGRAEFKDVSAGVYRLVLFHAGRLMGVGKVSVGGRPAPNRRITVKGTEPLQVVLVTSGDPVMVQGVVERDGKPVPGVLVLLVPAGADTSADLFRRDQSDLDGGFRLPSVAPGDYIAIAVEDGWKLPWTDVGVVSRYLLRGVPVSVSAGRGGVMRLPEAVVPQPK